MSWQDDQYFFWANNTNPMVAISPNSIHGIVHATGTVTGLQIGDSTGILPALCTGFVGNTCGTTQNCIWCRDHANEYNDTLLFVTGRPITSGVSYVANNPQVGDAITWFSTDTKTWNTGAITFLGGQHTETFGDGSTAEVGIGICNGPSPTSGDSGSPVFLADGDFLGSISGSAGGGGIILKWAYPSGSIFRPSTANVFSGSPYDYEEV